MSSQERPTQSRGKIAAIAAVIGIPVVAYLAFGVFGVHTLFIDDTVDEAGPIFASAAEPVAETADQDDAVAPDSEDDASVDAEVLPEQDITPTSAPASEIVLLSEGSFIAKAHPTSGTSSILNDGSTQRFLRFEDFETDNGPDLFVYLTSADASAGDDAFAQDGEFINLGQLRGNIGDQNYEIPADVDLDIYDTVVIWCRRFSVSFGAADLA